MIVSYSLIEKGLDFVDAALSNLTRTANTHAQRKRHLKYTVLHLSSGVELLLKEKLNQQNWKLVFEKTSEANAKLFESGNFFSVKFPTCIERLESECGVSFTSAQEKTLNLLRRNRNKLEHFGITDSQAALTTSAVQVIGLLLDFIHDHFDQKSQVAQARLLRRIKGQLAKCEEFVKHRDFQIADSLSHCAALYTCPCCHKAAWTIDGDNVRVRCLFCTHDVESEIAAEEYADDSLDYTAYERFKEGIPSPIHHCPECSNLTLVDRENDFLCFACGEIFSPRSVRLCDTCSNAYSCGEEDSGMCDECIEHLLSRE